VTKVWNTIDKHVKMEMTSVVHGKWAHEESIATASMATNFLIIKARARATPQGVAVRWKGAEGLALRMG
jgi:4-hydroxy-3-methylbut-2-enyl diphosphate reductase